MSELPPSIRRMAELNLANNNAAASKINKPAIRLANMPATITVMITNPRAPNIRPREAAGKHFMDLALIDEATGEGATLAGSLRDEIGFMEKELRRFRVRCQLQVRRERVALGYLPQLSG